MLVIRISVSTNRHKWLSTDLTDLWATFFISCFSVTDIYEGVAHIL